METQIWKKESFSKQGGARNEAITHKLSFVSLQSTTFSQFVAILTNIESPVINPYPPEGSPMQPLIWTYGSTSKLDPTYNPKH